VRSIRKKLLLSLCLLLLLPIEHITHAATTTPRVTQLSTGSGFSVVLRDDGYVWTWGINNVGQLGLGSTTYEEFPVRINGLTSVISIAASANSVAALRSNGDVYTWGLNSSGQLGLGNTTNPIRTPTKVTGLSNIRAVYAGGGTGTGAGAREGHMFAIDNTGAVFAWGLNDMGQLGIGTSGSNVTTPRRVTALSNIRMISVGSKFTVAVDSSGNVWQWGRISSGNISTTPVKVAGLSNIKSVNAGMVHTVALSNTGRVFVWGENSNGELGLGKTVTEQLVPTELTTLPTVASVFAGRGFSHVLTSTGRAYGWGSNDDGQMAIGDNTPFLYDPTLLKNVQKMVTLSGGYVTVLATRGDNELWQWGFMGKIDDPKPADFVYIPTRIAPKRPDIKMKSMATDNKSALFTIDYKTSSLYVTKQYSFSPYGPWEAYTGEIRVDRNRTTIYARGIDGMGHVGETASLKVNNLDGLLLLPAYNTIHKNVGIVADAKEKVNTIFLVPSNFDKVANIW